MRPRHRFPQRAELSHTDLLNTLFEAMEIDDPGDQERLRERHFRLLGIEIESEGADEDAVRSAPSKRISRQFDG